MYHVVSRVAHGELLLDDGMKERMVEWLYGVAAFSGVEVWAWTFMDSHFHLLVHVPPVPERYWRESGDEPASYAFGMRPADCRSPLWTPSGDGIPVAQPRPGVGFALPDGEIVERLAALHGDRSRAEAVVANWRRLAAEGRGAAADRERERLCRRMYNLSQFVKTFKERTTMVYNRLTGHEGTLWQGRFFSSLVEPTARATSLVAAYIDCNGHRAGLSRAPDLYAWNGASRALHGGAFSDECRKGCEKAFGRPWPEARDHLLNLLSSAVKETVAERKDADAETGTVPTAPKLARMIGRRVAFLSKVPFIGFGKGFEGWIRRNLPTGYPAASPERSLARCRRYDWDFSAA